MIKLCCFPIEKSTFVCLFISLIPWKADALCIISLEDSVQDLHSPVELEWACYLLLNISR